MNLKKWQGLWALIATWLLFAITPIGFQLMNLNAGVIDPAYIHALIFTAGVFFTAIFCAWLAIQMDWKILNNYVDTTRLHQDWDRLFPVHRVLIVLGTVTFLIAAFIACFAFLPKP